MTNLDMWYPTCSWHEGCRMGISDFSGDFGVSANVPMSSLSIMGKKSSLPLYTG